MKPDNYTFRLRLPLRLHEDLIRLSENTGIERYILRILEDHVFDTKRRRGEPIGVEKKVPVPARKPWTEVPVDATLVPKDEDLMAVLRSRR